MAPRRIQLIEIGSSHLACGGFTKKGDRLVLEHWDVAAVDPAWTTNLEHFEQLVPDLTAFVERQPRRTSVLLLPGRLVLTKMLSTPAGGVLPDPAEHIPLPLGDVTWGWHDLGRDPVGRVALLAATRRAAVETLGEAISAAGLAIERVVPAALGLITVVRSSGEGPRALVSIGARSTLFTLIADELCLVRTMTFGGEVEPQRLQFELQRTLEHWRHTYGITRPATLFLAGGGSRRPDLSAELATGLALKVERYDAASVVEIAWREGAETERLGPEITGAAQALLLKGETFVDLSPERLKDERRTRRSHRLRLATAGLVALALLPPLLFYRTRAGETLRRTQRVESELRAVKALQSANTAQRQRMARLEARVAPLRSAYSARNSWVQFLGELQAQVIARAGVSLDRLQVAPPLVGRLAKDEGRRLVIGGRVVKQDDEAADGVERVKAFLQGLASLAFVAAVEAERFEPGEAGSLRFTVTLVLKPDPPL